MGVAKFCLSFQDRTAPVLLLKAVLGSRQGWFFILGLTAACTSRSGFEPRFGDGAWGGDGDGGPPVSLQSSTRVFQTDWVYQSSTTLEMQTIISRSDGLPVGAVDLEASVPWLEVVVTTEIGADLAITLIARPPLMFLGNQSGTVWVSDPAGELLPASIGVHLFVLLDGFPKLIGPGQNSCPHISADGTAGDACQYVGSTGVADALATAVDGDQLLVYGAVGEPAIYDAPLSIGVSLFLGTAPGVSPTEVSVRCFDDPDRTGVLKLKANRIHLQGFTILAHEDCWTAVGTWDAAGDPDNATGEHLIENIIAFAAVPERFRTNAIVAPLWLGPDTTVRNSHFLGYWQGNFNFTNAHRLRLIGNTFTPYQKWVSPATVAAGRSVLIANNIVINPGGAQGRFLDGEANPGDVLIAGNIFEGFGEIAPVGLANLIDNAILEAPLVSPADPRVLADAAISTGNAVAGEGTSLDGRALAGRVLLLPGAYQVRAEQSLPRRTQTRLGAEEGCGANPCDILASEPNEVQRAVWGTWPGGTLQIYPSAATSYAGPAVISWPLSIVGMGQQPEEVWVTESLEDTVLADLNTLTGHSAVFAVIQDLNQGVRIENLSIRVDGGGQAHRFAILTETGVVPATPYTFRRLRIEGDAGIATSLDSAFSLGDRVLLQDVLVQAPFRRCVRFGTRSSPTVATPPTTSWALNLSCRLTGTGNFAPVAAFEVGSMVEGVLANIALELAEPAPVLLAQSRLDGTIDPPTSLVVRAFTSQGHNLLFEDFTPDAGAVEIDTVSPGIQLFVDSDDSRLTQGSGAIDTGLDPATLNVELTLGTSLDGVSRQGRVVDRGAFEQGL